jgi:phage baseplate assembly protein W
MPATREHLVDIHPETGEYVQGFERIKRSIVRILQTRLKTRLMREWFGSDFINVIDKPLTQEVWMDGIIAAQKAVNEFEPEFKITVLTITRAESDGSVDLKIQGVDLVDQANATIRENISLS